MLLPYRPPLSPPPFHTHARSQQSDRALASSPDGAYDEKHLAQRQELSRRESAGELSKRLGRDSVISQPLSPASSFPPSPSSSSDVSHDRRHPSRAESALSPTAVDGLILKFPPNAYLDVEKCRHGPGDIGRVPPPLASHRWITANAVLYGQGEHQENELEDKALQILLYLSLPCAFISLLIALWAGVALLVLLILTPLRLCTPRPCLKDQIATRLIPTLSLQLRCIYSDDLAASYSLSMLIIVSLLSPFVAFGIAFASWVAAAFWLFTTILGDPGGNDGHNDGKESILTVRGWWERWLARALRDSA